SYLPSDASAVNALLYALFLSGLFLTLGLFPRFCAFAAFIILLTLDSRNHFVFHPAFALLRVMLLYLSLSPCGDELALGRMLYFKLRRSSPPHPVEAGVCALRIMQLQVVAVYLSSLAFQLSGSAWLDGRAVFAATHLEQFLRLPVPSLFDKLA